MLEMNFAHWDILEVYVKNVIITIEEGKDVFLRINRIQNVIIAQLTRLHPLFSLFFGININLLKGYYFYSDYFKKHRKI